MDKISIKDMVAKTITLWQCIQEDCREVNCNHGKVEPGKAIVCVKCGHIYQAKP
jgi:hypothetical protein